MARFAGYKDNTFYNQEFKVKFIDYLKSLSFETYANISGTLFRKIKEFEERFGRDCKDFTEEQQSEAFEQISGFSAYSRSMVYVYNKYVTYCTDFGIQHEAKPYSPSDGGSSGNALKTSVIANPFELRAMLDRMFVPVEEQELSVVTRCIVWLSYMGLTADEILTLTPDNFDFEDLIVHVDGRKFTIYPEAIKCLKACCTATEFKFDRVRYEIWMSRTPGNLVVRGCTPDFNPETTLRRCNQDCYHASKKSGVGKKLNIKTVYRNGLSYRIFQHEVSGHWINWDKYTVEFLRWKTPSDGPQSTFANAKMKLRADYKSWKEAIGINVGN